MDQIDAEFGPLRKSKGKADSRHILKDSTIDYDQNSLLQRITLLPIKRDQTNSVSKPTLPKKRTEGINQLNEKEAEVLQRIRLVTKNSSNEQVKALDPEFKRFRHYLLRNTYQDLSPEENKLLSHLREPEQEIDRILRQAIVQKESHSTIIVGPRESYKSFLLNRELDLLSKQCAGQFITIRLNGFIHSEQAAINGIATQLEQQLKHLHDDAPGGSARESDISSGSLTEVFEKILRVLDSASTNQKSTQKNTATSKLTVIFIFDEIDTFAGPVRQSLLYNLFDMVEHARVPVCIVGCTTKLNILEFLEKRVKSRFSQRIIYMPQVENLEQFVQVAGELLELDRPSAYKYGQRWNQKIQAALSSDNSELYRMVKLNYETFRSIPHFRNSIIPLIHGAEDFESLCHLIDTCEPIKEYMDNQLGSSFTALIGSLSDLELAILICAARTALKTKDETMNFNLTYAEYESMTKALNARIPTVAKTGKSSEGSSVLFDNAIKLWKKKDVKNVWETLIQLNFLTEKSAVGLRESAIAVFYASNYQLQGTTIPFDLRQYQTHVTLSELRRIVPRSSLYYSWTQL